MPLALVHGSPEGPKGIPAADAFGIMSFIVAIV